MSEIRQKKSFSIFFGQTPTLFRPKNGTLRVNLRVSCNLVFWAIVSITIKDGKFYQADGHLQAKEYFKILPSFNIAICYDPKKYHLNDYKPCLVRPWFFDYLVDESADRPPGGRPKNKMTTNFYFFIFFRRKIKK